MELGEALWSPDDGLKEAGGAGRTTRPLLHDANNFAQALEEGVVEDDLHVLLQLVQVDLSKKIGQNTRHT